MLYVVIVVSIIYIAAAYRKSGEFLNPISALVVWWGLWLCVANLNPVGLYVPSGYTQFLYLLMIGSVVLGGMLARPMVVDDVEIENERVFQKWRWIAVLLIPIALLCVVLFYKAYTTYLTSLSAVGRADIFGQGSVLFSSQIQQILYHSVSRPMLLTGLVAGLAMFILRQKSLLLVVISVLYLLDAIMMLGRRELYLYLMIAGVVFFIMIRGDVSRRVRKVRSYGTGILILLASAIILVTSWRVGDTFDVGRIVERYVVQYHTGGFTIFDQELQDPDSRLNTHLTLGRSTLGTIEKASVILFFRKIDGSVRSEVNDTGSYFTEFRKIGYGEGPPGVYMNAYNTILYTMYIDGREVAVILFSLIYGYFLMGHYLAWRRQRRVHSFMICVLLIGIGFIGLFNSPLEGPELWGGLIIIAALNRLRLKVPVLEPQKST